MTLFLFFLSFFFFFTTREKLSAGIHLGPSSSREKSRRVCWSSYGLSRWVTRGSTTPGGALAARRSSTDELWRWAASRCFRNSPLIRLPALPLSSVTACKLYSPATTPRINVPGNSASPDTNPRLRLQITSHIFAFSCSLERRMAGAMIRSSFPAILKTLRISLSFQPIISIQIGNGEQPSLVMTSFREEGERERERDRSDVTALRYPLSIFQSSTVPRLYAVTVNLLSRRSWTDVTRGQPANHAPPSLWF